MLSLKSTIKSHSFIHSTNIENYFIALQRKLFLSVWLKFIGGLWEVKLPRNLQNKVYIRKDISIISTKGYEILQLQIFLKTSYKNYSFDTFSHITVLIRIFYNLPIAFIPLEL